MSLNRLSGSVSEASSTTSQFVSRPPPSSSTLAACDIRRAVSLLLASAVLAAHSSSSSRKRSHTQLTQPDMQQLSGSTGRGGTHTPATLVECRCISSRRSAGPARREPKTTRALALFCSWSDAILSADLIIAVPLEVFVDDGDREEDSSRRTGQLSSDRFLATSHCVGENRQGGGTCACNTLPMDWPDVEMTQVASTCECCTNADDEALWRGADARLTSRPAGMTDRASG